MSHEGPLAEAGPAPQTTAWIPAEERDKEAVREQVGRIVSSALFRNSKRFPAFLRYTVEHALESREGLKERTIGSEVFGRDAGYDTSQDPIVRMTATEVRKRLVQYYQSPEHAGETIVSYQPGSYIPEFFVPSPGDPSTPPAGLEIATVDSVARRRRAAIMWAAGIAAVILVAFAAFRPRTGAVDRFWGPLLASSSPVLLCIGDPSSPSSAPSADAPPPAGPATATITEFLQSNRVRYTDSVTLALLAGELRARGKAFRIRRPAATELKDLRDGPVILIGGFNNPWTLKLNEGLRFTLSADHNGSFISDRDRPASREWQTGTRDTPLRDVTQTYGLITRIGDPATGHTVVTVSGLVLGTRAAGECAIDASCLSSAERMAQGNWDGRNVQIVVGAAVIGEDSGAPRVLAAHVW